MWEKLRKTSKKESKSIQNPDTCWLHNCLTFPPPIRWNLRVPLLLHGFHSHLLLFLFSLHKAQMPRSATACCHIKHPYKLTWNLKILVFKTEISSSRNPTVQVNPPLIVFDTVCVPAFSEGQTNPKTKSTPGVLPQAKQLIYIYIHTWHTYVNSNLRTKLLYAPGSAKRFFSAVCMSFKSLPMSCQVSLKEKFVVFAPKKTSEKKKHPNKNNRSSYGCFQE